MRIIAGILLLTSGTVRIAGVDIRRSLVAKSRLDSFPIVLRNATRGISPFQCRTYGQEGHHRAPDR
jgi:hypothetical protein